MKPLSFLYIGMLIAFLWDLLWVHTDWKNTLFCYIIVVVLMLINEFLLKSKESSKYQGKTHTTVKEKKQ